MEARRLKAQSQGVRCLSEPLAAAEKGAAGTPGTERAAGPGFQGAVKRNVHRLKGFA